jgi:diaminopimelate decarboxylase
MNKINRTLCRLGEWFVTRNQVLAGRFGTPLYVYDLDRVVASYRDLRNSLPAGFTIFLFAEGQSAPGHRAGAAGRGRLAAVPGRGQLRR